MNQTDGNSEHIPLAPHRIRRKRPGARRFMRAVRERQAMPARIAATILFAGTLALIGLPQGAVTGKPGSR
ncbi:MAG: hypothetical protein C4293_21055, partial [Nitrospiraceae bacterium]